MTMRPGQFHRAERFVAALPAPLGEDTAPSHELERALEALVAAARAAWPALPVTDDDLLAHVAARMSLDDQPEAIVPTLCAGDLLLAAACLAGDTAAIAALHAGPLTEAIGAVRRRGTDDGLADDVHQRVATMLVTRGADGSPAKLARYAGRGRLGAFVRVIAVREAHHLQSRHQRERPTETSELFDLVMVSDDPAVTALKASYREVFRRAFADAMADLSIHDRLLLRQHFLDGLTIDQLCVLHRVHRSTAARWLGGVRDKLFTATRRRLQAALKIDRVEFDEVMQLIGSQLDASIRRLLASS